jgi:hypothetical protein
VKHVLMTAAIAIVAVIVVKQFVPPLAAYL